MEKLLREKVDFTSRVNKRKKKVIKLLYTTHHTNKRK